MVHWLYPNADVVQLVLVLALVALAAARPDFDFDIEDIHQSQEIDDDNTYTGSYRYEHSMFLVTPVMGSRFVLTALSILISVIIFENPFFRETLKLFKQQETGLCCTVSL